MAATSVFAQVTLTGTADIAFTNKTAYNGAGNVFAKTSGITDGLNAPNRIMLTVNEDLGGGLKATFFNEHAISPTNAADWGTRTAAAGPNYIGGRASSTTDTQIASDAATSTGTNRQTHLTVAGGFGHVRAGYLVASLYNASAQSGYFLGVEQYGALLKDFGMAEVGNNRAIGMEYKTPAFGMFTGTVQKLNGTDRNPESTGTLQAYTKNEVDRTAYRVDVNAGALKASYVRDDYSAIKEGANGVGVTSLFGVLSTTNAANSNVKATHDHLSAIYTMGAVDVTYQYNKLDLTNNTTATSSRNGTSNQYGVRYTMGNTSFYAITGSAEMKQTSNGAKVNDIKNSQFGVRHNLSKRTVVYAMTGTSKDSIPVAADTTRISKGTMNGIGLMHNF